MVLALIIERRGDDADDDIEDKRIDTVSASRQITLNHILLR